MATKTTIDPSAPPRPSVYYTLRVQGEAGEPGADQQEIEFNGHQVVFYKDVDLFLEANSVCTKKTVIHLMIAVGCFAISFFLNYSSRMPLETVNRVYKRLGCFTGMLLFGVSGLRYLRSSWKNFCAINTKTALYGEIKSLIPICEATKY